MKIKGNTKLLGVGKYELDVLEKIYYDEPTYRNKLSEDYPEWLGSSEKIRNGLYRLQEAGLIEVDKDRSRSNKKYVETTVSGFSRLVGEGRVTIND